MTLIEIKPHRWGWKVFETLGVEHKVFHFPELRSVISVERTDVEARSRSGNPIRIQLREYALRPVRYVFNL
jgi:hypothetical protein